MHRAFQRDSSTASLWSGFGLWACLASLLALDYWVLPALSLSELWLSRSASIIDFSLLMVLLVLMCSLAWRGFDVVRSIAAVMGHIVRARLGWVASRAPDPYIRQLFDGYADRFDNHLVNGLSYGVPSQLLALLQVHLNEKRSASILDLGCGTGLCGVEVAPYASRLVGLDLSEQMLLQAVQRKVYDELVCDSIEHGCTRFGPEFDWVVAADVFCYAGSLEAIFQAVKQVLRPEGGFAFSVERTENRPWVLNRTGRFAHSRTYIQWLVHRYGFKLVQVQAQVLRTEKDLPVHGDIYLLRQGDEKPADQLMQ